MKKIMYALIIAWSVLFANALFCQTPQSLPFSQNWTNTSLISLSDNWSGHPGIIGYRGDDITTGTAVDPQTLLADGTTTPVDVNANQSNPGTFTTGGVTEFELANPVVALAGSGTADAPFLLIALNTTGFTNVTVNYNLRDLETVHDAVQQVAFHYRVGNTGSFTNLSAGYVPDATDPVTATKVTPVSVILPAAANNQPVVHIRIMTTNAASDDEWVGIDDISITGTPSVACNTSSITAGSFSTCNNNNTADPADDTFTASVTVNFTNPPATGTLNLGISSGGNYSVPVANLNSMTSHTFTGVVFPANGQPMIASATWSEAPACNLTEVNVGTALSSCSGAVCSITNIQASNISACSDNGTPFASDDFFTANVTVTFSNPPASGALTLSGDVAVSVPVNQLGSATSHTFTGLTMSADGGTIHLTAFFTADPACTLTAVAGTAPNSCSCGLKINEIDYDQVGTDNSEYIELYNPCGSAINIDDYSVELVNGSGTVVYLTVNLPNVSLAAGDFYVLCANAATTPNCDLDMSGAATDLIQNGSPDAVGLRFLTNMVDAVSYEGDTGAPYTEGTGTSAADNNTSAGVSLNRLPNGSDTNNNNADFSLRCSTPGSANSTSTTGCVAPCNISALTVSAVSACDNKGTTSPGDDTFTASVTVTFVSPPATGTLELSGDGTASVAVGSLSSATSHTFTGVTMSADGSTIVLTASFSAGAGCSFTNSNAGTAPASCSNITCVVSSISVSGASACNDNGTPHANDDFFTANVTVTFTNPPSGGTLNLTGDGMASVAVGSLGSPTSHTFNGVMMTADGGSISLTAAFSEIPACALTNNNAGTAPASCSCALKINEVDYDQAGTDAAEFIELYNPCGSAQNIDNYFVELVNGNGGGAAVYQTVNLPSVTLAAGDYYVICANASNTINCDLDITPETNLIQNGNPDAIGLKYLTFVVDAVSYGGNTGAPYTEGTGTSATDGSTAGIGLSRFPNGSDTNNNTTDFSLRCITPGTANSASTSNCVAVCNIVSVTMGTPSACDSKNTSNPADDTFTANVTVTFSTPPATGNLRLTGDPIFAPIEVPVSSLSGTSHVFTGVVFAADGGAVVLTATFTADAACTLTNNNAGTAPSACSCNISAVTASNISACNDQGTSTPTDDRFTANVTVTFANPPASGNLLVTGDPIFSPITVAVGSLGSTTSHTFNNVAFSADGTTINLNAFFSADATCAVSNPNAGTAPLPCSPCEITSVSMVSTSGCNSNGTPNPADDFFTADVTVTFFSKPATGNLLLNGGVASAAVGSIGATSHTFSGVQLPANGSAVSLTASFSANPACTLTNPAAGTAPGSCSPCGIVGIALSNVSPCQNQNTLDPSDDFFTADVVVSFFNAPGSGTLDLTGDGSASTSNFSGNSHTFTGLVFPTDGTPVVLSASFSANSACSFTNNNAGNAPQPCSNFCFVNITDFDVTHESCANAGDASLVITANGSGQLAYSIDGGGSFNLTGVFDNLTAGTYPIEVWVLGDPTCSDYATVTVTVLGSPQTWYKDIDGDLYSDGVTQVACTQPVGFQLAANLTATSGDCNDYDANERPNQTWYRDADGDGYSNGAVLIQCARPFGFKTAAELTQTFGDCNDNNAAIRPGAPELCNGLDDDCDGQVDEGAAGGLTYVGNVTFTTQAQVNAFSQCYSVINGNLTIQNAGISSLANLINLAQVTGNVTIKTTSLTNMAGLNSLTSIGGNLLIYSNNNGSKLASLDGLEGLNSVGGNLKIYWNFTLSDCCAIEDLLAGTGVGGTVSIYQNDTGCDNVTEIMQDCNGGGSFVVPQVGNWQAAIFEQHSDAFSLTIFPNPTSGSLNIIVQRESGQQGDGELLLHDLSGKLLWRQATDEQTSEYGFEKEDLKLLPGLYLLEWRNEQGRIWQRVVMQ